MKSFKNFYNTLPQEYQKQFKIEITKALGWNDDQFYKKMRGETKIWAKPGKNESDLILLVAKRFWHIYKTIRSLSKEIDESIPL